MKNRRRLAVMSAVFVGFWHSSPVQAGESEAIQVLFRAAAMPQYLRDTPALIFRHTLADNFVCNATGEDAMDCIPKSSHSDIQLLQTTVRASTRSNRWELANISLTLSDSASLSFDDLVQRYLKDWPHMTETDATAQLTTMQARCGYKVYQNAPTSLFNLVIEVSGKRSPPDGCLPSLGTLQISFIQGLTIPP